MQRNSIRTLPQLGYLFLGHLVVLWRVSRCYRVMPKDQKFVSLQKSPKRIYIYICTCTPIRKVTWTLKMIISNRNLLVQGGPPFFRCHVSFPGAGSTTSRVLGGFIITFSIQIRRSFQVPEKQRLLNDHHDLTERAGWDFKSKFGKHLYSSPCVLSRSRLLRLWNNFRTILFQDFGRNTRQLRGKDGHFEHGWF